MILENRVDLRKLLGRKPNRVATDGRLTTIAPKNEQRDADERSDRKEAQNVYFFAQDRIRFEPPRIVHDQRDGYAHEEKIQDDESDKNQPLVRCRSADSSMVSSAGLNSLGWAIDFCLEALTQLLARLFSSVESRRLPWLPLFPTEEL